MARWSVKRLENGYQAVTYDDFGVKAQYECGELHRTVPEFMILEWVLMQGKPKPGDFIVFASGRIIYFGNASRA